MTNRSALETLHIISASAGTGKTERLSREVAAALAARDESRVDVEGLVAVTYTRKAEAELRTRIRQTLVKQQLYDEAQRLPLAYVGTVHAICHRLIGEFAFAAGLSPQSDLLPESASERALTEALEIALDEEHRLRIDDVCSRLRPNLDSFKKRPNWISDAEDLIDLARSNRVAADAVEAMAGTSLAAYGRVLGRPERDGDAIDAALRDAIEHVLRELGEGDGIGLTTDAIVALRQARVELHHVRGVPWSRWEQLSKLKAAKGHAELLAVVNRAAARHRVYPRFHDDIATYTRLLYVAVRHGLASYRRWKEERRYIDYVDMEERALDLLERADVAEELAGRLQLLVVDEFQDTSPIQLALFLRLESLCRRAVWVGDRKQSIFAFRGADPMLMDEVVREVAASQRQPEVLATNHRSRRELVDFTSELFARAFAPHGYDAGQVRVAAYRDVEPPRLAALPPLGVWLLESTAPKAAAAIAEGVRELLAAPADTPVVDHVTGEVRDVRASDLAILAATNDETLALAKALGERGIAAAVARKGLLETPEGTLLHAALRFVADERDAVARAHLDALAQFGGQEPEAWLEALLRRRAAGEPALLAGPAAIVDARRAAWIQLSPSEAVDELIDALDLCGRCARWPRPSERLGNLEAFRGLVARYETECAAEHRTGSIVGLLHFLSDARSQSRADSQRDRQDDQHAGGLDAVEICTYHRAKGLEWPVVILSSLGSKTRAFGVPPDAAVARLERGGRSQLFSAVPELGPAGFDARAPLRDRWLRFWPWPYGGLKKTLLLEEVETTDESQRALRAAARESLRLLYVGFTRARDHLILAMRAERKAVAPPKPKSRGRNKEAVAVAAAPSAPVIEVKWTADWLETLNDGQVPLLRLPEGDAGDQALQIVGSPASPWPARVRWLTATDAVRAASPSSHPWYALQEPKTFPGYRVAPSRAADEWPELSTTPPTAIVENIGPRLAIASHRAEIDAIGTAFHAVFAADPIEAHEDERVAVAGRILTARGLLAVADPKTLVAAHTRLHVALRRRFGDYRFLREVPIAGLISSASGERQISGSIDLLLDTADGWVVVDHKSYPGTDCEGKAQSFAAQIEAYVQVLQRTSRRTTARLVHFPASGHLVELR